MTQKKIAVIGSVGVGKTTLINRLSNNDTINTDVVSSVDIGKEMTTVGIDYGQIYVDDEINLALYGVPGQRKYSLVWDFVKEGLWGLVILVKDNDRHSIEEMDYLLDYFSVKDDMPCVIGVTHFNNKVTNELTLVHECLRKHQLNLPVYTVDTRIKEDALMIMNTLIALAEEVSHV
ncbi:GTP-binding protein [Marinicella gelatinilytica]|uniref:GTP-binding protein n=1 Tax=Marinicella gelatinilytica TaxID=2996017 RepID=UPI002260DBF3|nr:GTPase [Marinicella gelatinilytica]MCX7545135.1 50S ribosome-binding GTPase [Marinicella gelatinilytica]